MKEKIKVITVSTEVELKICFNIRKKVFIIEQKVPRELEVDEYEKESTHFLAFYKNTPAATGRFRIFQSFLKFERIATLKSERGKGIGLALMQKMQKIGIEKYPTYLQFANAQKDSIKFYQKLGWQAVGDFFIEANIPHQVVVFIPKDRKMFENLKCLKDEKCPKIIKDCLKL